MKKEYTKPVIILENFSMTQSIAHNCGDNLIFDYATLKYKGSCGWDDGSGVVLFTSANTACTFADDDESDNLPGTACYNNPEGGFNIFNS
ncbi:MAG: hypothetical protein E7253_11765 [Lachnospiraceae bacterium]|nr:hypothetical protein [Lachnospiraceae bacterium]